jgi:hypothetical protein
MEQIQDVIKMRGHLEIVLGNLQGQEIERRSIDNVIVTVGRRFVLQQIASSVMVTSHSIGYMVIGTTVTAPATGDTSLTGETTRNAIVSFTTTNLTSNPPSWRAECSFASNEGNTTLAEVGLINSSANGTLLGRATFATLNKTTSNTLSISYTVSN